MEVREYQTAEGKTPVTTWLAGLREAKARSLIVARLDRLKVGLFGDWKSVGEGVCELRIDYGPGYRVYYAQDGRKLVLLLCAGDKQTQAKDIKQAHAYWKDYKARKPKPPVPSGATPQNRGRHRRLH